MQYSQSVVVGIATVIATLLVVASHALAITYTYDPLNRLTRVAYDDGSSISYTYDAAGNISQIAKVGNDNLAPTVTVVYPAHGATNVVTSTDITATFSEPMDASLFNSYTFSLTGPNGLVSGSVAYSGTTATFTPSVPLAVGTSYTAVASTWLTDQAGNPLATDKIWSFTTAGTSTANLEVTVIGSGNVTSNPAGIACNSGTCSSSFDQGTSVSLIATANAGSSFGGWSGACSGTGGCTVVMSADKSLGALFNLIPRARIGATPYGTLTSAFLAVGAGQVIEVKALTFVENLLLDRGLNITLRGGYADDYSGQTGYSELDGTLTIGSGSLVVDRIVVK
jgi:YD repeat-containing protein